MKVVISIGLVCVLAGCGGLKPNVSVTPGVLRGSDYVVYFEQSDRIPQQVMLATHGSDEARVGAMVAIPPEVIAAVIKELFAVIPKLSENISQERMQNALINRRMLFLGYTGDELKDINSIIQNMGGSIEYFTPQNKHMSTSTVSNKVEVIGGTDNLGTGLNVEGTQKRLHTLEQPAKPE